MPKHLIAQRLKDAMGLHTPTVGMITISSAIKNRMHSLQINTQEQYLCVLDKNKAEMQNLIEAVIIPETWFFRDDIAYKKLLEYMQKKKNHCSSENKTPIRILSAPCSSGEEPYSVAMLLADQGFEDDKYEIDAVDISQNLIAHAQKGIYGNHSFRANDLSFVDRHFTKHDDGFMISNHIKDSVRFHNVNILDKDFLPGYETYDVILCRNLLIYFDEITQARVFSVLNRLLKGDGILMLGHAETSQKSAGLFEAANELGPYVNRKATNTNKPRGNKYNKPIRTSRTHSFDKTAQKDAVKPVNAGRTMADNKDKLETAFILANEGHTKEAIDMCIAHIECDRFSSRVHYLLGLLHDSNGDNDLADNYLRKALYLDPNNIEALIHLSLMAEQRGDIKDSERLRNRAERVQSRSGS